MSSRVPPGQRIHTDMGDLASFFARESSENWFHRKVFGRFLDSAFVQYTVVKAEVTVQNTGNDDYPIGTTVRAFPPWIPGPLGQTFYIYGESALLNQDVMVEGMAHPNGEYKVETATLNGTTAVQIGDARSWMMVNRAFVDGGASANPQGRVWVTNTLVQSPAGRPSSIAARALHIEPSVMPTFKATGRFNESMGCHYMVPSDYEAWIIGWSVSSRPATNSKRCEGNFWLDTRKLFGFTPSFRTTPWRTRRQIGVICGANGGVDFHQERFGTPILLEPWEEVRMRFVGVSQAQEVRANLDLLFRRLEG